MCSGPKRFKAKEGYDFFVHYTGKDVIVGAIEETAIQR